jgi:HD-GYP domain-containing protein (c-di-GMP phosphodiesterase class II)
LYFGLFYTIFVIYSIFLLSIDFRGSDWIRKNQIKYLLLGVSVGFLGGAMTFLPVYGIRIYPLGTYLVSVYVLTITYAILKYRLMDIRVALTRAGVFVAVYTMVLGLPFAFGIWSKGWLMAVFGQGWWLVPLGIMAALATLGPYFYIYIDKKAEEALFRELKKEQEILRDYKKDLEGAAKSMILVHDPDVLIRMIVRTMVQKVKVTHAGIMLYDEGRDTYVLTVSRGAKGLKIPSGFARMDMDNALIHFFRVYSDRKVPRGGALVYAEAKKGLVGNINTEEKELLKKALYQMEMLGAVVCIPSYFQDELLGVLLLGGKNTGEEFGGDELDFFSALASDVAMAIRNAWLFKELEAELDKKHRLFIHTTVALAAAIDAKDHYTHGHTARVTNLSMDIAKHLSQRMKLISDEKFFEDLHIAALLHDIGKIGIPEAILNKDGPLDEHERKKIQEHPVVGATILQPIKELASSILGVKYHHEKYDGSGYPEGLKGDQIPLLAAIISVADCYDAMTTDRPYRKGMSREEALEEIRRLSSRQFHPQVAEAFYDLCQEGKI